MFFRRLFKRKTDPVFWTPAPLSGFPGGQAAERRDVERAYARTFTSDDGKTVLGHLQNLTFARAYGADAPESQLRYAEGQRALVGTILRLVGAGRNPHA
jgi:hypothetical protein